MYIGIAGFGHLGKALAAGLLNRTEQTADQIGVYTRSEKTLQTAQQDFHIHAFKNCSSLLRCTDVLFLTCPPDALEEIFKDIDQPLLDRQTVVSFAAGVSIPRLKKIFGEKACIIRAMPTIAIEHNQGIIAYTDIHSEEVKKLFQQLGWAVAVKEEDIDKITAFASCGLGFAAYLLNAYQQAGTALGLDPALCHQITEKNFSAALQMGCYDETVKRVSTTGGATACGIEAFQRFHTEEMVANAVLRAFQKLQK